MRAARSFGPAAPQTTPLPSPLPSFHPESMSEDCLTVNAWTPGLDGHRPVLVWIHGGAFTSGGASQPVYDGARLAAEQDVVVVTLNYRLGALGFLSPPGGDDERLANVGLHDQLAGLAWVRDHAAGLGGDPRSVTVVGESAGAGSILHLLTAAAGPLPFDRAIAQSGEPRTLTREQGETVAAAFTHTVEADGGDAGHLESTPLPALLAAQDAVARALFGTVGVMVYAPTVDGRLLRDDVLAATGAGRGAAVPLVLGTTREELRLFPDPASDGLDDERLGRRVARLVPAGEPAATVAAYREQLGAGTIAGDIWEAVRTDAMMRIPNLRLAEHRAAHHATTFVYRFDWAAPGVGAAHAVDLPFTFATFDREGWGTAVGADADAEQLGHRCATAGPPSPATGSRPRTPAGRPTSRLAERRWCSTTRRGSSTTRTARSATGTPEAGAAPGPEPLGTRHVR